MSNSEMRSSCRLCDSMFTRTGMTRHLKSCLNKHLKNKKSSQEKALYHIHVYSTDMPEYFLHLCIDGHADLACLDRYLRDIWLECCGHMSCFYHSGNRQELSMGKKIKDVLFPGALLPYMYDFGDTTELHIKNITVHHGALESKQKVQLLARNAPPVMLCDLCQKNEAEIICLQCQWENKGCLCTECVKGHVCEDDMFLPVVNSPRVGVCAYCG